jgi:hypothetical protein
MFQFFLFLISFFNFPIFNLSIFNFHVYYTTFHVNDVSVTITIQFYLILYFLLLFFFSSTCPTCVSKLGTHCS